MVRIETRSDEVEDEVRSEIQGLLKQVAIDLTNEVRREAPVDSGYMRRSCQILNQTEDEIIVGVRAKYASAIQFGTRPFYPPLEPLKRWARRKLGAEEIAGAVQEKIATEGIDANPFVSRAIKNLEAKYS